MSGLIDAFTVACVLAGAFFFMAGTVGLLRFPDAMSRVHALTKPDNLGLGLIVLGLLPRMATAVEAGKLVLVWLLVQVGSATAAQLLAVRAGDEQGGDEQVPDELERR
jgi:multicomponent Na+:H+ antiporter subunit G